MNVKVPIGILLNLALLVQPSFAEVTKVVVEGHRNEQYRISGYITENDFRDIKAIADRLVEEKPPASSVPAKHSSFLLESDGGDVEAAIGIGRQLRRIFATAYVDEQCNSACVFVLAGAVDRIIRGKVGIHRPYSQRTDFADYKAVEREQRRIALLAKTFLYEMNLPTHLYEEMVRVPPEKIRIFSKNELGEFGLNQTDPAFQEWMDSKSADRYGLSKKEYLSRKGKAKNLCAPYWDKLDEESRNRDRVQLERNIEKYKKCEELVFRGHTPNKENIDEAIVEDRRIRQSLLRKLEHFLRQSD